MIKSIGGKIERASGFPTWIFLLWLKVRILQLKNIIMAKNNIADLRREYKLETLDVSDVASNPFDQFKKWFDEALNSELLEPNAMVLSTVSGNEQPAARVVLLKGYDEKGLVFFTNYGSSKAKNMAANPKVCLLFDWSELERQVRIEGIAEKIPFEESEAYFQSRPRGSQIGAWASPQSQVIGSRQVIEQKVADLLEKYQDQEVLPCPPHWGGYIVKPTLLEFWQGRPNRLHDRILYTKLEEANWRIERLAP